jgi:dephospho-CoA kinase
MQGGELAALDAIELIGSGLAERCDFTVAVTAPEETRIRRIMARDGISRQQAELRVHAQRPNSYFEENCDHTLTNDSDSEDFICRFNQLMEDILRDGKRERQSVL